MTLLTVPEVQKTKQQTYRYYCELAHRRTDGEGVTLYTKTIDVVVAAPTREAITDLIAGCEWLADYQLVSYNMPETDKAPF